MCLFAIINLLYYEFLYQEHTFLNFLLFAFHTHFVFPHGEKFGPTLLTCIEGFHRSKFCYEKLFPNCSCAFSAKKQVDLLYVSVCIRYTDTQYG